MTWCWHISCQHSADATRKFIFLVQQDIQQVPKKKKKQKNTIWWDYLSISWAQSNQKDQTLFFQHFCSSKIPCQELLRKKTGHSFYHPCLIPCKGLLYMNINPSHQNILRATLCAEGLTYLLLLLPEVGQAKKILENPLLFCWIYEEQADESTFSWTQFQRFAEILSFPALRFWRIFQQSLCSFQHWPTKLTETNCFQQFSRVCLGRREMKSFARAIKKISTYTHGLGLIRQNLISFSV